GVGQFGYDRLRCGRIVIGLVDHDPTSPVDDRVTVLVPGRRPDVDDTGATVAVLLEADDLGAGGDRVTGDDRSMEAQLRVAEVGDGVERDVGHRLAEGDVEPDEVLDGMGVEAAVGGEGGRGGEGESGRVERTVEGTVA